mmetsp:Transcript_86932/g.151292  ORF Transcript_86932/g.151292 Transcript_86932/m.151292 type:complete len:92 (-) Transcript_86932:280-555(-)
MVPNSVSQESELPEGIRLFCMHYTYGKGFRAESIVTGTFWLVVYISWSANYKRKQQATLTCQQAQAPVCLSTRCWRSRRFLCAEHQVLEIL